MKKIVLMLLSVVMAASLTSCGDNEEPTPKSNNYVMLYRVIMAKKHLQLWQSDVEGAEPCQKHDGDNCPDRRYGQSQQHNLFA